MIKRVFDFFAALFGFVLLLPLFACLAILIGLDSSGPIFFRQERVGRFGRLFLIHKFRTMTADAETRGPQITACNDQRVTRVGAILRKYKLDELPQLIDVIKGDMSLVGPRPEVPKFVAMYSEEDRRIVLSVRPGITDYASLEFRDENILLDGVEDPERQYIENILPIKLAISRRYVSEYSFLADLKLVLRTISVIIRKVASES